MEDKMKLEMKIISRENIKPSIPTPLHLKTIKLSVIDQIYAAYHTPLLLLYNASPNASPLEITTLKSSLSFTLSQFYPIAGRCIDDSTISCNDEGIPFIETHVNSRLSEFLTSSHKNDFLTQLLPPQELFAKWGQPISEMVPLAFQINVFACGGVVIGCFKTHKFLDMTSMGTFFQYWAALATQRTPDTVDPNFDPIIDSFPPSAPMDPVIAVLSPSKDPPKPTESTPIVLSIKSFRFTKTAINNLKAMAMSEAHPNPTSFETVLGFVWKNAFAAACTARKPAVLETTAITLAINMRSRTNPPLPRDSMGNCVVPVLAKATKQGTFQDLVGEIHGSVSKAKSIIEKFRGVNGGKEMREYREEINKILTKGSSSSSLSSSVYRATSWCKLGLSGADFGFGKPNWIIPHDGSSPTVLRNFIIFTDYYDDLNGDGIEAWLFLDQKEMQVLLTKKKTIPRFCCPG